MTTVSSLTQSLIVERVLPHSAEKIWRALTDGSLLEQWVMPNDFQPVVGHRFTFRMEPQAHWNGVTEGEVRVVRPCEELSYRWDIAGQSLHTVVTWTLTPVSGGVLLRMQQSGFGEQNELNHRGASHAWPRFLSRLEHLLTTLN
ncbi:SRPBCC domain-containing protein (plasmid) [Deinococcus sp. KNUC1210]|uniref:SRPBCC family protein n=1 Tax=Deinococcus sp. KNUC1210 TaxID=2917691 RepID=UPI001EF06741|nr:SRPBCC domain-containing protein [Deinococcus sp. KNUC1210]ULH14051.1 SRPBCC domain-containing protein [Deinococcus sp. KNUC1210]